MIINMPENPIGIYKEEKKQLHDKIKNLKYKDYSQPGIEIVLKVGLLIYAIISICQAFLMPKASTLIQIIVNIGIIMISLLLSYAIVSFLNYSLFKEDKKKSIVICEKCEKLNDAEYEKYMARNDIAKYESIKVLEYLKRYPESILSIKIDRKSFKTITKCKIEYESNGIVNTTELYLSDCEERTDIEDSILTWNPYKLSLLLKVNK